MNKLCFSMMKLGALTLGLLALPPMAGAQYFQYDQYGDVLAGFRKTGQHQGNYELVVNLGNVTNFLAVSPGAAITIPNVLPARLSAAFPDGYQYIQWSVFAAFPGSSPWVTPFGPFPKATFWYTLASADAGAQTVAPQRIGYSSQGLGVAAMLDVGASAFTIASADLGVTNENNNTFLVREPVSYPESDLTAFIGDRSDPTIGDFGGSVFTFSVENTTPSSFLSAERSDFYQSCPKSSAVGVFKDPITGATNGPAYFVGYFLLNPNGAMTFTRASTNSVQANPPPPVTLSLGRAGNGSTISFVSSNSVTYTLFYTDSAGLSTPVTNWSSVPGTISGDGTMKSFQDATSDRTRFYRVQER